MNINISPELIGVYEPHMENDIEGDVSTLGIQLSEEEIAALIEAISNNIIAKLPDGFQGGREQNNPDVFKLYTTRHHQKI